MLPNIDLSSLGSHVNDVWPDGESTIREVVKQWIVDNLMDDPPSSYVDTAINGIIEEKLVEVRQHED